MFHILPQSVLREVWFMGLEAGVSDLSSDKIQQAAVGNDKKKKGFGLLCEMRKG
jgi:hypothetical protein